MISVDSPNATLLSDQLYDYDNFLFQLVKDPTRNGNILDLVFVTSLDLVYDLKVQVCPFLTITRSLYCYRGNRSLDRNSRSLIPSRRQTGII